MAETLNVAFGYTYEVTTDFQAACLRENDCPEQTVSVIPHHGLSSGNGQCKLQTNHIDPLWVAFLMLQVVHAHSFLKTKHTSLISQCN